MKHRQLCHATVAGSGRAAGYGAKGRLRRNRLGRFCVGLTVLGLALFGTGPWSSTAGAEWRDLSVGLRIGVAAGSNPGIAVRRIAPFARHIRHALDIKSQILAFRSLNAMSAAHAEGRIDIALYSVTSFLALQAKCGCVEALAVPLASDGSAAFHAIAVTRKRDAVDGLSELQGRAVAMGPQDSTASFRLPAAALKAVGELPETYFHEIRTIDDPADGFRALIAGDIDAVFTWSSLTGKASVGYDRGPLRMAIAEGGANPDALSIAWQSPPIPHGPLVVRSDLAEDLKAGLAQLILGLLTENPVAYRAIEPWFGGGFVEPDPKALADLADFMHLKPKQAAENGAAVRRQGDSEASDDKSGAETEPATQ